MHVDVDPLQPPFTADHVVLHFKGKTYPLAVSLADYDRICDLLGSRPEDRLVELSAMGEHIRIKLIAS